MRVSIITAYYKNEDLTKEFLDNLIGKVTEEDEVIVVNAGSNPIEHPIISRRIDLEQNKSFSNSMNAGLREAKGDYICIIGNDGFPTSQNWLETLINALESTNATIVVPTPTKPEISAYNRLQIGHLNSYPEYKMFPAICYLMRRQTLTEIGYFDERFEPGCYEDDDYCLRVKQAGGRIIRHPKVFVRHLLSQTVKHFDSNEIMRKNYHRFKEKWGNKAP